jgi:hypothetical protein
VLLGTVLLLTACASSRPNIYLENNLNVVSVGMPKDAMLQQFAFTDNEGQPVYGLRMRAARRGTDGKLIEVAEMPLLTQNSQVIQYWFLFVDGRLAQWGRPRDWQSAAGRYQVDFSPSAFVPR